MLLKEGANLEQKDGQGRTPVIAAAAEGHSAVVEHLVSKKARGPYQAYASEPK